jgi:ribosomal protein S11
MLLKCLKKKYKICFKISKLYLANSSKKSPKVKKIKKKINVPIINSQFLILLLQIHKRNIFSNVRDLKGVLLASISIGILSVRGKERNTNYSIESAASLLCKRLRMLNKAYLICIIMGKSNLRKKRRFLKTIQNQTPIHILKIQRFSTRSHNGCRPTKIRRL